MGTAMQSEVTCIDKVMVFIIDSGVEILGYLGVPVHHDSGLAKDYWFNL